MNTRQTTIAYAISTSIAFSLIMSTNAFGEEATKATTTPKQPGTIGRAFRKMRHPFTNFKAQQQKAAQKSSADTPAVRSEQAAKAVSAEGLSDLEKANMQAAALTNSPSEQTGSTEQAAVVETKQGKVATPTALDTATARQANDVPGVNVKPGDMASPVLDNTPIKGFHPIKRIMRPVENLAKQSVILGQNIMRLEAPMASLQPSMVGLKKEMGKVENRMSSVQSTVGGMQGTLGTVSGSVTGVRSDMRGVRSDLSGMRSQINQLEKPIRDLHDPLVEVSKPVSTIQKQLAGLDHNMNELKTLLATVLASIYIAAGAIAFGTPLAAFLVYKNRAKLFPHTHERDMPVVASADKVAAGRK